MGSAPSIPEFPVCPKFPSFQTNLYVSSVKYVLICISFRSIEFSPGDDFYIFFRNLFSRSNVINQRTSNEYEARKLLDWR